MRALLALLLLISAAQAQVVTSTVGSGGLTATAPGYGYGCTLSNDSGTPNTVIDISACSAADETTFVVMPLTAAFTKTTGAWAVGSGNGGLDTGAIAANTWYYVYQIQRSDTGVVDYLMTATLGAPTMPTSYTRKRYIGAIKTAAATTNLLAFTQVGNEVTWAAPVTDITGTTLGTASRTDLTLPSVPNGYAVKARLRGNIFRAAGTTVAVVNSRAEADVAAGSGHMTVLGTTNVTTGFGELSLMTDTAQRITGRANQASSILALETFGWVDPLINWPH